MSLSNILDSQRDESLDIMKGIGILLVVFAHVFHQSGIVYQFHMPLFFILCGAAMTYSKHPYSFERKFKSLMIPYLVFSLLCFVYWAVVESKFRPIQNVSVILGLSTDFASVKLQQFINIFLAVNSKSAFAYNIVLWFLPCLFVTEYIYSFIKSSKYEYVVAACLIAPCYFVFRGSNGLPLCLGMAVTAVPFLALGFHTYQPFVAFLKKSKICCCIILVASVITFCSIYAIFQPHTDMAHNVIPYTFYIMAILGSIVVITASLALAKMNWGGQIAYLGKNSLIIMCIHEPIKRIIITLMAKITHIPSDMMRDEIIYSFICTLIVIAICIPIIEVINRYLPWMIGRKI